MRRKDDSMKRIGIRRLEPNRVVNSLLNGRNIYGIGARYGSDYMVTPFLEKGVIGIGYDIEDVPEIWNAFIKTKKDDIIYMKALGPSSECLCVMGIGFIINDNFYKDDKLGILKRVHWCFENEVYLPEGWEKDKHWHQRLGTIYQEFSPRIQNRILDMMLNSERYPDETED